MRSFLILGHPKDVHASYVAWALGAAGYATTFINPAHHNCPTRTTLYIDDVVDEFDSPEWERAEAIWCRRLSLPPSYETQHLETADEYTLVEERRFTKWVVQLLERSSARRWINRPQAAQTAENKLLQLRLARACGICIPRTLITAQSERLRAFLQEEQAVVAKPLDAFAWQQESGGALTPFASVLTAERGAQLTDADIDACITVYQQVIDKAADVRIVVMGEDVFAYKITQNGEQHFDYRVGFNRADHLSYELIAIPDLLQRNISRLMQALEINFASADFVLTPAGDFVFLDLNPNGQWLFIEAEGAEADISRKFCSFFVDGAVTRAGEDRFPSYRDYLQSVAIKAAGTAMPQSAPLAPHGALRN